ncbi:MAG: hypothetical protein H7A36_04915 [Chlamydiales bacterium]|nr:hypothetical protein [Chlamydiales bacterium]
MAQKRLIEQLELLREVIDSSPYLSRGSRKELEKEIAQLRQELAEQRNLLECKKKISDVELRVASNEVDSVLNQIHHLNPSSPRLSEIRLVATRLFGGEISAEQSREEIHKILHP